MFARYAFAPNQRGYCGPADAGALLEGRTGIPVRCGGGDVVMRWMLLAVVLLLLVGVGYYGLEDMRRYLRLRNM